MSKLFEPMQIGSMTSANRLMLSAMGTQYLRAGESCNKRLEEYLVTRAQGGWGIIVVEMCSVAEDTGMVGLRMYNEEQAAAFRPVTTRMHEAGAKVLLQIMHPGRREPSVLRGGTKAPAPSAVAAMPNGDLPHEMTTAEVWAMIEKFIRSAEYAKKAGFDGVEIHCGHGWLLSAFMSPISNKRTDEFGGSIAARCKIAVEIIKGIKERCGRDFTVTAKISTDEYVDGGIGIQEAKMMAWLLEKAGVDALHCTQGIYLSNHITNPPSCTPRANFLENAKAIKSAVHIPVMAVGRINDPELAEFILETTDIDMISMARASLADPELPKKAKEGRLDDIIRCVGCLQMCLGAKTGAGIGCMLNPMTGREWLYKGQKAANKKKVYVAGGGVAGAEAAIAAAEKGHEVTLFEKTDRLGGQWRAAAVPVGKEEFAAFIKWQTRRLSQLGVTVKYEQELDRAIVDNDRPDVVLVACGATPFMPPVKGIDNERVVAANDVLLGRRAVGKNVVVIGGGLVGAETADHLAFYGSKVTIVEMMDAIAKEAQANVKGRLLERLSKRGVRMMVNTKLAEITADAVIVETPDGTEVLKTIDTIVIAVGSRSNNKLADELAGCEAQVITIGDAAKVKLGSDNITEAFLAAYEL